MDYMEQQAENIKAKARIIESEHTLLMPRRKREQWSTGNSLHINKVLIRFVLKYALRIQKTELKFLIFFPISMMQTTGTIMLHCVWNQEKHKICSYGGDAYRFLANPSKYLYDLILCWGHFIAMVSFRVLLEIPRLNCYWVFYLRTISQVVLCWSLKDCPRI